MISAALREHTETVTLRGEVAKTADTIERSKRLREACEARDWKQKHLIAATGIDRSTVSKHWNGTAIPMEKALVYAEALGNVDPEDLAEVVSQSLLKRLATVELLLGLLVPRGLLEDDDALAKAEKMVAEAQARLRRRGPDETRGSGS